MSLRDEIKQLIWERTEVQSGTNIADAILALPELITQKRDAKQGQNIAKIANEYGWNGVENSKILSEFIRERLEKADKWDNEGAFQEIKKAAEKWWSIQELVEVVEKCKHIWDSLHYESIHCPRCHGTGEIVRPATAEEVREFIEYIFTPTGKDWRTPSMINDYMFQLSNGGILRMRAKS